MGLTTALNTSLNGLSLNETQIEVLGNNIANAGTNGFKASTVHFTTQLARTLSVGSAPQGQNGGTNPRQVGLGATTAAINKDFSQGAISGSTSPSDLAIEGSGFFIVEGNGGRVFSRNGNFGLNNASKLVNDSGLRVQGYGVDSQFNVVTTQLVDIEIPLGKLNVALETTQAQLNGALKTGSGGVPATRRGVLATPTLFDTTGSPLTEATGSTLLKDVGFEFGQPLFRSGETIGYSAAKGGAKYDKQLFDITDTTTLDDYMGFMQDALGIDTLNPETVTKKQVPGLGEEGLIDNFDTLADNAAVGTAGVSLIDGRIVVISNLGTSQAADLPGVDLTQTERHTATPGTGSKQLQINFQQLNTGDDAPNGESVVVTFPVYDSLGEQVVVRMHAVLQEQQDSSTIYRYYFESADDSDRNLFLSTGTITLDGQGDITGSTEAVVQINRERTAASDMQLTVDFRQISGLSADQDVIASDASSARGTLNLLAQNGAPPGTLSSFNINEAGVISGVFTNGVIRTLGQIMLAQFPNPQGLVENGAGTFIEGVSSGPAQLVTPGEQGSGTLRAGAIELSNTDVGRSLVDLIVASTNYRGNARVISSVQQLVDELLVLGR